VGLRGREYLDFLAGIAVCNTGHCHPQVVARGAGAGRAADARLNLFTNAPMVRLAERLAERSFGRQRVLRQLGRGGQRGGAEARAQGAPAGDIVVLHGGFHGRTFGALSATPQESKQAPFAPLVPGFDAVAPDGRAGAPSGRTPRRCCSSRPGRVGRAPAAAERAGAPRAACDEHGALLIVDEVQTGMGRTGTLWALRALRDPPDVMTLAKGPRRRAADRRARHRAGRTPTCFAPGDHGSTFAATRS
jgi:acetylornithine/succinyldiaminopimelate/putrescine aminotransferase